MESNSASSQPAINICSRIKCPFYNSNYSCNRCTRYFNSRYCHLPLVFAFKSDGYSLFTTNESELRHIKQVNDNWITQNTDDPREVIDDRGLSNIIQTKYAGIREKFKSNTIPTYLPYFLGYFVTHPSKICEKFLAINVTMLNSIQFEKY